MFPFSRPRFRASVSCAVLAGLGIAAGLFAIDVPQARAATTNGFSSDIQQTTYMGLPAYRLSDGKTEAVVVPQIGRIMRYGKVGGRNILWNAESWNWKARDWKNYGGEKDWLSPQSSWGEFHGSNIWPPDPVLDGTQYDAKAVAPGVLEIRSQVSPGTGIRITRTFSFAPNGDFVIKLTASKDGGAAVRAGLWSIAQVVPGEAVFVSASPHSVYKKGYLGLIGNSVVASAWPDMIRVNPSVKNGCKIGVDSDVASIVSISHGIAFLSSTPKLPGQYPDGPDIAGCPVELYVNDESSKFYCELELLGPLVHAKAGSTWSMTIHWSLHNISTSASSPSQLAEAARRLLYGNTLGKTGN
ncbi:MAG: hypothetical protein P4L33_00390 [Capsulimonadaceae bacterium]|nr:hypothetical protein [Capsulimonadaceae bacterium]